MGAQKYHPHHHTPSSLYSHITYKIPLIFIFAHSFDHLFHQLHKNSRDPQSVLIEESNKQSLIRLHLCWILARHLLLSAHALFVLS